MQLNIGIVVFYLEFQNILLNSYAKHAGIKDIIGLKTAVEQFSRFREIEIYAWVHLMNDISKYSDAEKAQMKKRFDNFKPNKPFKTLSKTVFKARKKYTKLN